MSVGQMGHPRPWRSSSTSFTQASQKHWWPHGTSAIRASRWATRHTSQSFMSGVATVATMARNFLDLSSGAFASYAFAPSLCSTLLRRLSYVRLSILCRSRVFRSRVFFHSRVFHPVLDGPDSRVFQSRVFSVPLLPGTIILTVTT